MRVGLVVYGGLEASRSGGFLYDARLKESLEAAGDEVLVLSQPEGRPRHARNNLSPAFARRVLDGGLDVLIEDELNHASLFLFNRLLKRLGGKTGRPPVVALVHHLRCGESSGLAAGLRRVVEQGFLRTADAFVFNSRHTRDEVLRLAPAPRPHIVATPGGDRLGTLDERAIAERCRRPGPLTLLYLGNVVQRKGLLPLMGALARLPADADWKLLVAGGHDMEPGYALQARQAASRLPDGRVEFLGRVADESLPALLGKSHVLAMPFAYEGFGISYLEAMAHGLPCLGSERGGAAGIIDGRSGFLLPPDDLPSAATIILSLARNRETLLGLSLGARHRFAAFPTWDGCARSIRAFLRDLARDRTS